MAKKRTDQDLMERNARFECDGGKRQKGHRVKLDKAAGKKVAAEAKAAKGEKKKPKLAPTVFISKVAHEGVARTAQRYKWSARRRQAALNLLREMFNGYNATTVAHVAHGVGDRRVVQTVKREFDKAVDRHGYQLRRELPGMSWDGKPADNTYFEQMEAEATKLYEEYLASAA